ncbi:MAG: hypothetical protein L6V93_18580 [Clostridiales bacterium]|nr:MAG: hypothetical protein L6V93_18580 [Clostridiales bacterium]
MIEQNANMALKNCRQSIRYGNGKNNNERYRRGTPRRRENKKKHTSEKSAKIIKIIGTVKAVPIFLYTKLNKL